MSLGDIGFEPAKSLAAASRLDVVEAHGQTRWSQQGTGSQRALFWSMLEVRSELNRLVEERKQVERAVKDREKELSKREKDVQTLKKADAKKKAEEDVARLKAEIKALRPGSGPAATPATELFLPGYMLLIDEPETALHPTTVRAAKEHLYSLAAEAGWQVMLGTHHPAFVDPLKDHTTIIRLHRPEAGAAPNIYRSESITFTGDEKQNLKTLLAFDNTVAEMFFGSRVIIVEGDTEFAAFTEAMDDDPAAFPLASRPLILRARGKATIPILIKMLTHFKLDFAVLHDIDSPKTLGVGGARTNGAYSVNAAIVAALVAARAAGLKVAHRCSCPDFEQQHGMGLVDKDKPFQAWKAVRENATIRASVRTVLGNLAAPGEDNGAGHPEDGQHFGAKLRAWAAKNAVGNAAYYFD